MNYPRAEAIHILGLVLSQRMELDRAIDEVIAEEPRLQAPGMRAWLTEVCAGTLRWKGRIDLAIDAVATKKKPTGWLRRALSVAAFQVIGQDRTPHGRVVSETIDLIRRHEGEPPARFANALLRRVSAQAAEWRDVEVGQKPNPGLDPGMASVSPWFWHELINSVSREQAIALCDQALDRPDLWIFSQSELGTGFQKGPIPYAYKKLTAEDVEGTDIPLIELDAQFFGGKASSGDSRWVQDLSSQRAVARVVDFFRGMKAGGGTALESYSFLDLCASPGGKSMGLAAQGVTHLSATDFNPKRMPRLKDNLERVAPKVQVIDYETARAKKDWDVIWIDAPCTGSGTLQKNPEIKWNRKTEDLKNLVQIQSELLDWAFSAVKPTGYVIYSVCSVFASESTQRVQAAIKKTPGTREVLSELMVPDGEFGSEGFFLSILKR